MHAARLPLKSCKKQRVAKHAGRHSWATSFRTSANQAYCMNASGGGGSNSPLESNSTVRTMYATPKINEIAPVTIAVPCPGCNPPDAGDLLDAAGSTAGSDAAVSFCGVSGLVESPPAHTATTLAQPLHTDASITLRIATCFSQLMIFCGFCYLLGWTGQRASAIFLGTHLVARTLSRAGACANFLTLASIILMDASCKSLTRCVRFASTL
jgi:hypothetical protein